MADDHEARIAQLEGALAAARRSEAKLQAETTSRCEELSRSNAERDESRDQQAATAEILRVIATSPSDPQPVLDAIVNSASRLSASSRVSLYVIEGDIGLSVANIGVIPGGTRVGDRVARRRNQAWHAIDHRQVVHIPDMSVP